MCRSTVAILLIISGVCRADTIQLSSGQEVHATVTNYKNNAFDVRGDDGKTTTVSASSVRRVQFEAQAAPAKILNRTRGAQEASVVSYENGAFIVLGASHPLSPVFVERIEFVPNRGQEIEVLTHGQQVDIKPHLAPGNVTIVEFYADWCGPCKKIAPLLEQWVRSDPTLALRKIDIVNWQSAVAKQYGVHSIPHVQVYNRKGQLVGEVAGVNPEAVLQLITKAKVS